MPPSSGFSPLGLRRSLWVKAESRCYGRAISADALLGALISAFILRISGLREMTQRMSRRLCTRNFSSLSHALSRPSSLVYVQALIEHLQWRHAPRTGELVALDSMAVTLPITQRHRCVKYNAMTAGGGVLWAYALQAARGACPVKVLRTLAGSWNDTTLMEDLSDLLVGPVYLMDRGFFGLKLIQAWLGRGVRFIVRARFNSVYETRKVLSRPRVWGCNGHIELDAIVRLGCKPARAHPRARMIRAVVGRQVIIVVTSELTWSAEQILQAYKQRERIEQFHRFLKDNLGLAHLYSFSHTGIMLLLHTALLLAMLLFLARGRLAGGDETIARLRATLNAVRKALGLGNIWKRNTNTIKRSGDAKKYKWQEQLNL